MEFKKGLLLPSIVLGLSILFAGIAVALGMGSIKGEQRTVTVRGLAEREVDADLAAWPIAFSVVGNDLSQIQKETLEKIAIVRGFLKRQGIADSEITVKDPSISDATANQYINQNDIRYKYVAKTIVLVRSTNIANVNGALSASLDLLGQGIAVTRDEAGQVQYSYSELNSIKPDMIAEATKNARVAAEQFARDSGSKVGKIKNAVQGLFSINDADPSLPQKKIVRVVTTVEYFLVD